MKLGQIGQFFIVSFINAFMLTHYIDLHANILVFSIPIQLMSSCLSALSCNDADKIIFSLYDNAVYECYFISEWSV